MNFKKTKVAVASGLMAASMVLAPLAAYADDSSFDKASIQKTVNVADGVTISGNIHFSVTQVPNQGEYATVAPNEDASTHEIDTINDLKTVYKVETDNKTNASDDAEGTTHQEGDFTYVESVALDFSPLTTPGEYTFVVKELKTGDNDTALTEATGDNKYGWTFNTAQYLVRVYVKNDNTKTYTIQKGTYDETNKTWTENPADNTKKDTAAFENTFTKRGNEINENDASLVIEKKVTENEYADPNAEFEFTIKFEADQNSPAQVPSSIDYEKIAADDTSTTGTFTGDANNEYTFTLKKNEKLSFADLPAGIHYTVTESDFTNKQSTKNSAISNNIPTGERDSATTEKQLIGENVNSAEFTNTFKGITITGVVTHSAPFVIMVGALFVAVGGYVVLKKRIEE